MATFLQLYGILLDRELGSEDTLQLFTTVRRKAAINEGQLDFVRQTGCFTKRVSIPLSDGQIEYDLEAVIAADDFLDFAKDEVEVKKVSGSVTTYYAGPNLPRRDIPWLNRTSPGWRGSTPSTPTSYYIDDNGGTVNLGLVPAPDIIGADTWTAEVTYVAAPGDMSADGDQPFSVSGNPKRTLRLFHQGLVHYAAGKLEELRKNYQAHDRQMQLYGTYVADYLGKQRRVGGSHVLLSANYIG